jgi:uncharacterized protein YndB with AHSA1/START domain
LSFATPRQGADTVVIRRPPREVFRFLADLENIPKWNYAIMETEKTSQGPVASARPTGRCAPSHPDARKR